MTLGTHLVIFFLTEDALVNTTAFHGKLLNTCGWPITLSSTSISVSPFVNCLASFEDTFFSSRHGVIVYSVYATPCLLIVFNFSKTPF